MENGNYVLSLLGHGIKVIDLEGKLLHSINFDAGLQDESVYAMYLDQSGLLWLGLDNGIAKVELNSQLSTFSKQMGLKTAVLSIARVNHTLYLGTATGLYFFDKAKRTFELLPKIAPIQIFDLVKDGEDLLIPGEGLNVLRTTTGEIFQVGKEFNYFITLKLSTQFPDILYMGGNSGITVFRRNRNKSGPPWLAEGNFLGITKDIYTLTESKEGDIWAGTQSGIVYKITPVRNSNGAINFQSSKTEIFGQENGLINAVGIVFGVNGKVYVPVASEFLTYDASTKRLVSDPTFGKITVDVFEVENFFLKDDSSGRVWMPLGNKIRLATPLPEGGYKLEDELFNAYPLKGIYSILPEGDGIVWIGSEEGLVRFDENVKARPNRSFKALLRQITSGKDSLSHINSERKTKLDNKNNSLRFTYAAPFYNQEERTLYQTLLDGFDEDWSKWDRNSYKEYTNLSSGTYTFRVRAKNLYNTISQEATYTFAILPPWYGTWWAITLFAWLFIGLIWVVFYYRSRQLRKENRILEHKVSIRTAEVLQQKEEILAQRDNLENTLNTLKSTQNQLIQAEKMASLGELTTGIAHEIQNPLNFINNFSEVNKELIEELEGEMDKGNTDEVKLIINDIKENEQKVLLHGKRADAIVKSMLQHSRTSSGERQATDINVLADEYLRLAYHGLRAKDKEFNVKLLTDFDEHLPKTEVVPQEIGRVFLNLFNNAFYATIQKKLHLNGQYQPQVKITTKAIENKLEIRVTDNGTGIPENVKNKIFQPFFTTKPTGEGTGLGLSLSYDIITKGHSGELQVQSKEGEFTELIISLPLR
jgi:signal transduction histidine kinase